GTTGADRRANLPIRCGARSLRRNWRRTSQVSAIPWRIPARSTREWSGPMCRKAFGVAARAKAISLKMGARGSMVRGAYSKFKPTRNKRVFPMTHRRATQNDCPLLAKLNHQLIRDEGHRNTMNVAELEARMRGFIE